MQRIKLFPQHTHIKSCVKSFLIEFPPNFIPEKFTECILFCYDNIHQLDYKKNVMFFTSSYTKFENDFNQNLYTINFWKHDKPCYINLLNTKFKFHLYCPHAIHFYMIIADMESNNYFQQFWYQTDDLCYNLLRINSDGWWHAFPNNLNPNVSMDYQILKGWKTSLESYFNQNINFDLNPNQILPEKIPPNLELLLSSNIRTNDNCTYYIDHTTKIIYSKCNQTNNWSYPSPACYMRFIKMTHYE